MNIFKKSNSTEDKEKMIENGRVVKDTEEKLKLFKKNKGDNIKKDIDSIVKIFQLEAELETKPIIGDLINLIRNQSLEIPVNNVIEVDTAKTTESMNNLSLNSNS